MSETRPFDKSRLLRAFRDAVAEDLRLVARRQRDVAEGAVHEDNRAEHAKDTRATEDSYLARGLAERVAALQRTVDALGTLELPDLEEADAVVVGALVTVVLETAADGEEEQHWFLLPGVAGLVQEQVGRTVRAITPTSPLGQAVLGLHTGDEGRVRTPKGFRPFEVLAVL